MVLAVERHARCLNDSLRQDFTTRASSRVSIRKDERQRSNINPIFL